jgi:cephalosporin hydroxylase
MPPPDDRDATIRRFHELYYWGPDGVPPQKRISFLGVETVKCPLDLWVYQEIVHRTRPEVIVECGVHRGGTTLYLASLCDLLGSGAVVACDLSLGLVDPSGRAHPRVTLLEGSSTDAAVVAAIAARCRGRRTMVILDSDHRAAHVLAELRAYGPLVSPGCYLICGDTDGHGHPVDPGSGPGPMEAVGAFLAESAGWRVDRACATLLRTSNPSGSGRPGPPPPLRPRGRGRA